MRFPVWVAVGLLASASHALAAVVSVTGGDVLLGNRSVNLLSNGSFEFSGWTPAAPSGYASWVHTSTGNFLTGPTLVPAGWTTSGGMFTYAAWGNDTAVPSPGTGLAFSAPFPDGVLGVYMGNSVTQVAPTPVVGPDGVASFVSPPAFTHQDPNPANYTPFRIEQSVSGLTPGAGYLLDFWLSGEHASTAGWAGDGLIELDISGEAPLFFAAPYGGSGLGASQRYYVEFQPASSTVTFGFVNYGHLQIGEDVMTEGVLDDVILNLREEVGAVPEVASWWLGGMVLGGGALGVWRRRRGSP